MKETTNKKPVFIAITGTIGSGKSAAGEIAEKAGAFVIDTDFLTKELQAIGGAAAREIKAAFGGEYYAAGFLNRKALAKEVFSNPESLKKLNGIMHPLVFTAMRERFGRAAKEGFPLIIALIPLLFEAGKEWTGLFDAVWLVTAAEEDCIKRIIGRDKCSVCDAKARIAVQMPDAQKLETAAKLSIPVTVIKNDGGAAKLSRQVMKALKPYKKSLQSFQKRI